MAEEIHFDCLILGAGISGLDAAYHIQVILCQINIFCHLLPKIKWPILSELGRFTQIVLRFKIFASFEFQNNLRTLISLINVESTLTDFEKFHPSQNKNPSSTFIEFLDFSTFHSSFSMY